MLVKCGLCGKKIERRVRIVKNKYGTWLPKCKDCKRLLNIQNSIKYNLKRYREDPEFRERIIEAAKKRYRSRRPTIPITKEELQALSRVNSYPVLVPGNVGTSQPTVNLKVIKRRGKQRVKGAVWLRGHARMFQYIKNNI